MMDTVNIGFGNIVMTQRIYAVVTPESAPIKRMVADARRDGRLLDATYGRRTRSVIIMDNNSLILSAITPETIGMRAMDEEAGMIKMERFRAKEVREELEKRKQSNLNT